MKKTSLTCLLAVMALLASTAQAQEAPLIATNFSLTSNYKYRGQDQGNDNPAVQGGFDFSDKGFYIGNWNSSIGFTDAGLEMDFYAGYKGSITETLGFDVGVLQYYYPQKNEPIDFDTTEIYGAMSYGPATAKLSYTTSSSYFGIEDSRGTLYGDLTANFVLVPQLTLNLHVGGTQFENDSMPNYWDYKVGVTYDMGSGFSLAGAYVGADKTSFYGDINKGRVIVTITKAM
jgi:uncharacterized protein (TIGR02001 family)